jgi:hypothetical protein
MWQLTSAETKEQADGCDDRGATDYKVEKDWHYTRKSGKERLRSLGSRIGLPCHSSSSISSRRRRRRKNATLYGV